VSVFRLDEIGLDRWSTCPERRDYYTPLYGVIVIKLRQW